MSLATTCPQCKTSFKVVPDQLKLRRGLVRCGVCRHVFSGVDHLRYVEDPPPPPRAQRPPPGEPDRSQAAAAVSAAPIVPAELLAQGPQPPSPPEPQAEPVATAAREDTATRERPGAGGRALAAEEIGEAEDSVGSGRALEDEHVRGDERPVEDRATFAGNEPPAGGETSEAAQTSEAGETSEDGQTFAGGDAFEGDGHVDGEEVAAARGAVAPEARVAAADTLAGGYPSIGEDAVGHEPAVTDGETIADRDTGAGDTIARWREQAASGGDTIARWREQAESGSDTIGQADARAATAPEPDGAADADRRHDALVRLRMRTRGPAFRDTLPQVTDTQADHGSAREWLETARSSLASGPAEEDAVDFFASHRRARGFSARSSVFAAATAVALALALVVQLAVGARDWLAARVPAMRPLLATVLAPAGLAIRAPRTLDALTIESFELQSAGGEGMLSMSALLRNAADHAVRWPAMELSLSDGGGATVVRKVLMPEDYLGAAARDHDAIGPNAEWPVRVALHADGVEATAYSVKLFYP